MPISRSPSPSPPPTPYRRRTKACARKCERVCCAAATYFPLAFVYSLTTWAEYVEGSTGLFGDTSWWAAKPVSLLGTFLYLLLNISYTIAVFTDPGSPLKTKSGSGKIKYSTLPTVEPSHDPDVVQPITVSSTGASRYCKKCQTPKPDRTHHCSTCRRCVLKMDHHCPWLATCVGLHNYKAFVLFLVYTTLFCWLCFGSSTWWIWTEVFEHNQYLEDFAPVNIILLAVISGIIGLVLTGFTGWHLYLCARGQTTIECLEKTRYLGAVRRQVERQRQDQLQHRRHSFSHGVADTLQRAGKQILEIHANAIPGASRLEEGEERISPTLEARVDFSRVSPEDQSNEALDSPALQALRKTYASAEEQRERDRYAEYIDDKASEKLPNAFDLGWKRNLSHLFGPNPLLWALPVCNTTGDGWKWEISPKWIKAREAAANRREANALVTPYHNSNVHLHGGRGYDLESGRQDALSMQTLGRPGHAWATAPQKRDYDEGDVDGGGGQYQVSTDEEEEQPWLSRP